MACISTESSKQADNPYNDMWTLDTRKIIKSARRLWNESIRGHFYDWELAKTMGISIGMLLMISLMEKWFNVWLFSEIGLSYLYFLPIWYSARQGGRVAGFMTSFLTATKWHVFSNGNTSFSAWFMNLLILGVVMLFFEGFEHRMKVVNKKASTDALTGLMNRAGFTEKAKLALAHAERFRTNCALVLIDCNKFKEINDEHGHAAGDAALRVLSRALRDSSQGDDVIGRLGGDEFVVLLSETDSVGANLFMNRLNGTLRRGTEVLPFELTVSAGISYYGYDARSLDMLMQIADEKMYKNKQRGRMALVDMESENRSDSSANVV
jgi:diguanylate cyclase (GGDEF)-like protein